MIKEYAYTKRDLLFEPEHYHYTSFSGAEFLETWQQNRLLARKQLGHSKDYELLINQTLLSNESEQSRTDCALMSLIQDVRASTTLDEELRKKTYLWLKRFELRKCLFTNYDRKESSGPRRKLESSLSYLRLGYLFTLTYAAEKDLRFLNGLLKLSDLLISRIDQFDDSIGKILSYLISEERRFIKNLSSELGLDKSK